MEMPGESGLVAEAKRGSQSAARELFERHWPGAWRLAYALTGNRAAADDVAQDAFERAYRNLSTFDGRSTFSTWLARIVANRVTDLARRDGRVVSVPHRVAPAWGEAEDELLGSDLVAAVRRLPSEYRTVLLLRYWADQSPPEIAAALDVPVGTVHSRLARALQQLRSAMEVSDVFPA